MKKYTVADLYKTDCVIVYPKGSDNDLDSAYYLQKAIIERSGCLPDIIDDSIEKTSREIVIGMTSRESTKRALGKIKYNEYIIDTDSDDLVVTGMSVHSTEKAVHVLFDYIKKEEPEGIDCTFPEELMGVRRASKWAYAPLFEGGDYYGILESQMNSYYILYKSCSEKNYDSYLEKLSREGFSEKQSYEYGNCKFAAFTRNDSIINCYYIKTLSEVRIAVDNPDYSLYEDVAPYLKGNEKTLFAQLGGYEAFVYRLSDGRFIVIDGGFVYDEYVEKLHNFLKENNTLDHITIAAWFFSHAHTDHMGTFIGYAPKYGSETEVERIIVNNPSKMTLNASKEDNGTCADVMYKRIRDFEAAIPGYAGKHSVIIAHAGQRYRFADMYIEMLATQEDLYPQPMKVTNGSSLVFTCTLDNQRFMFLNDIYTTQSKPLVKMYGETMKSDIVQNAHHGYRGSTDELYRLIDADFAVWNADLEGYEARKHNPFNIYQVERAKENLIPGNNEVMVLEIPYREGSAPSFVREK